MARKEAVANEPIPEIWGSDEVPPEFRRIYFEIVSLTDAFCNERLDRECQELCWKLAIELCQEGSPVVRGKRASWACGIVYTIGWVNFLTDPNSQPHVRPDEIAEWFGVSQATMHSKSKIIREGLDIIPLDPDFTLSSRLDDNPLAWMVELMNGMIIDIRHAPREFQEIAYQSGLIPYIPGDEEESQNDREGHRPK
ncbi:MAG: DUF6398 domain-containing protein [Pirellulales bacterium]